MVLGVTKFFKMKSGILITEREIQLAYEITHGEKPSENPDAYTKFLRNDCAIVSIITDEAMMTVEDFIRGGATLHAIKCYREEHNCSLKEAKDAIDAMVEAMKG